MRISNLIINILLPGYLIQAPWAVYAQTQGLEVGQREQSCTQIKANKSLSYIFQKSEDAAGFLKTRLDACRVLISYLNTPEDELLLTTARTSSGQSICISATDKKVCTDMIADVEPGVVAGETLLFVYSDSLHTAGPQKQTVERLFIRPASIIR
jgi:hypothetical protein